MSKDYNLQHKAVIKEVTSSGKNTLIIKGAASVYRTPEGLLQIDRDGELVNTDFMDLDSYRKNPVLVFQHDWSMPMGKIIEIDNRNGVLSITAEVHRLTGQEHIFEAVEKGIIKSLSIGTIPEEIILRETHDGEVIEIARSTLVEISLTTVQSNQEALFDVVASKSPTMPVGAFAKQNGMTSDELKEQLTTLEKGVNMDIVNKEVETKVEEATAEVAAEVVAAVAKVEVKEEPVAEVKEVAKAEVKEEPEVKAEDKRPLLDEDKLAAAIVAANTASEAAVKQKEEHDKQVADQEIADAAAAKKARVDNALAYIAEQRDLIVNTPNDEFDTDGVQDFYELISDASEAIEAKVGAVIAETLKDDKSE